MREKILEALKDETKGQDINTINSKIQLKGVEGVKELEATLAELVKEGTRLLMRRPATLTGLPSMASKLSLICWEVASQSKRVITKGFWPSAWRFVSFSRRIRVCSDRLSSGWAWGFFCSAMLLSP